MIAKPVLANKQRQSQDLLSLRKVPDSWEDVDILPANKEIQTDVKPSETASDKIQLIACEVDQHPAVSPIQEPEVVNIEPIPFTIVHQHSAVVPVNIEQELEADIISEPASADDRDQQKDVEEFEIIPEPIPAIAGETVPEMMSEPAFVIADEHPQYAADEFEIIRSPIPAVAAETVPEISATSLMDVTFVDWGL